MREGKAFVGFEEGPINFAPTFKYDVLRTLKRSKTNGSRNNWKYHAEKHDPLHEIEEPDRDEDDDEGDEDCEGEGASMVSSVWTSVHSRPPTDGEDDEFFSSPSAQAVSTPILAHKISIVAAAQKAKTKWMALLGPTSAPNTPASKWRKLRNSSTTPSTLNIREPTSTKSSTDTPLAYAGTQSLLPGYTNSGLLHPLGPIRSTSIKSVQQSGDEDTEDEDKGVYDSSNKKRVPSWCVCMESLKLDIDALNRCDRILWKSTVHPDPNQEPDIYRPRTRVGQFFVNVLRPLTYRGQRESTSSVSSGEILSLPPKTTLVRIPSPTHNKPIDILDEATAFSRCVKRSRSNDVLRVTESPSPISPSSLAGSKSLSSRHNLRRSISAGQSPRSQSQISSLPSSRTSSYPSSPARGNGLAYLPSPIARKNAAHNIPSRWRFLPFRNRDAPETLIEHDEPSLSDVAFSSKKGDVVCLSYNTLDDRQMRRLEGRSDHRPVIGSYAVYL
jgi:hypothetical protein